MKVLIPILIGLLVVGCGESQQSAPTPETQPAEPVAEAAQPEPPTAKAPDISIHKAAGFKGNIEAVKHHLAAGADVNAKDSVGWTPLHLAAICDHKETAELIIANGADVNAKNDGGSTPLNIATAQGHKEIVELLIFNGVDVNASDPQVREKSIKMYEVADILRKHGGKTKKELEAEGK